MSQEIDQHPLTKHERRELRREEQAMAETAAERKRQMKKITKTIVILFVIGGVVALLAWLIAKSPKVSEDTIIARNGIHWHPELTIVIKGKQEVIPTDIGLGVVHQTLHTHDATGILHLEVPGLVTKDDTRLGRFFKIWGKRFDRECILDSCTSTEEAVKFSVNGEQNQDFENYLMHDKDKIEIRYE